MRYNRSRYLNTALDEDGSLILHSSLTGAIGVVPAQGVPEIQRALQGEEESSADAEDAIAKLLQGGMLVAGGMDEFWESKKLHLRRYSATNLQLIIMPTEQCNLRCVYCYETFERGTMSQELQSGLVQFVKSRPQLSGLELSWFGGEPLLAIRQVIEVTQELRHYCTGEEIPFVASATTNGVLLEADKFHALVDSGVTHFQVTLDGLPVDHDHRRVTVNGRPTFESILANLRAMANSRRDFSVQLRHNFDPESLVNLEAFLDLLAAEFGHDDRFSCDFDAVGKWGGSHDELLNVCSASESVIANDRARRAALDRGLRDTGTFFRLQPGSNVCYAAKPNSFVIGSDGSVYKCTVELDKNPRNHVGQLHPDGAMDLDADKMALWTETNGYFSGSKCLSCTFMPACHGAACPKEWMDEGDCHCPKVKESLESTLTFIRADALKFGSPARRGLSG